jgi:acyl-CoA thioester hydrolase
VSPLVSQTRLRVRYAETDQMGVVYHTNFAIWFEVGRVEFLRELGFTYRDMEREDDCYIAVVELRCRYKAPARYDDLILVRTRLKHLRGSLISFAYEIVREDGGTLLAQGETMHIVTDALMQTRELPEKYRQELEKAMGKG